MTSSNGNISRVNWPINGDFPSQRSVTRSFDVFFDLGGPEQMVEWAFVKPVILDVIGLIVPSL